MRKSILMIPAVMMLMACGGKKAQGDSVNADSVSIANELELINTRKGTFFGDDPQEQEKDAVKAFVEQFYNEWGRDNLLEYDYPKQHITSNLLKYLTDAYDFECEGECLATWLFFYEGGGDVGEMKSRQITARDESHVLVENKYENYEYAVLLTVIKDGDSFKIDSLKQERSEYK